MQQLYDMMDNIKNRKIKYDQAEVDRLHKVYATGPYSEAYKPELLKWALQKCSDDHHHESHRRGKTVGSGGGGKKQLEEERNKLILEIENG